VNVFVSFFSRFFDFECKQYLLFHHHLHREFHLL